MSKYHFYVIEKTHVESWNQITWLFILNLKGCASLKYTLYIFVASFSSSLSSLLSPSINSSINSFIHASASLHPNDPIHPILSHPTLPFIHTYVPICPSIYPRGVARGFSEDFFRSWSRGKNQSPFQNSWLRHWSIHLPTHSPIHEPIRLSIHLNPRRV